MRHTLGGILLLALCGCQSLLPVRPATPQSVESSAETPASLSIRISLPRETQALPTNTQSVKVLLRKGGLADRTATVNTGSPTTVTFSALPPGSGYTLYAASYSGLNATGTMLSWGTLPLTLASGLNTSSFGLSVAVRAGTGASDLVNGPAGNGAVQLGAQKILTAMNDFYAGTASSVEVFAPGQNTFLSKFGSLGTGSGQFSNFALEIAIDQLSNLWVSDRNNQRLQKFDAAGTFLLGIGTDQSWTGVAPGVATGSTNLGFNAIAGVECDASGNVYVADGANGRILKYDSNGIFRMGFGNGTQWFAPNAAPAPSPFTNANGFMTPYGVALDRSGNIVATDTTNHRVQIFNSNGVFLRGIGSGTTWVTSDSPPVVTAGNANRQFNSPWMVKVDAQGYLYVTDNTNRIQVLDLNGNYIRTIATPTPDKPTDTSGHLALTPTGLVYVTSFSAAPYFTQVFTPQGTYLSRFGQFGAGNGQVNNPGGMVFAPDGSFYQVDRQGSRVQRFQGVNPKDTSGGIRLVGNRQPDTNVYAMSGTYDTPSIDAGVSATWGSIFWNVAAQPANTGVATSVATSSNGLSWGAWVPVAGSSAVGNNSANLTGIIGRYLKVRVTLVTTDTTVSPEVQDVGVTY